jgi:hypothetical protein
MAALKASQPAITGMYKDLYQSFMPETLTTAASSGLSQLRADEEKLARLRRWHPEPGGRPYGPARVPGRLMLPVGR